LIKSFSSTISVPHTVVVTAQLSSSLSVGVGMVSVLFASVRDDIAFVVLTTSSPQINHTVVDVGSCVVSGVVLLDTGGT